MLHYGDKLLCASIFSHDVPQTFSINSVKVLGQVSTGGEQVCFLFLTFLSQLLCSEQLWTAGGSLLVTTWVETADGVFLSKLCHLPCRPQLRVRGSLSRVLCHWAANKSLSGFLAWLVGHLVLRWWVPEADSRWLTNNDNINYEILIKREPLYQSSVDCTEWKKKFRLAQTS